MIKKTNTINITIFQNSLDNKSLEVFNEYLQFLLENEIGFLCSEKEAKLFPEINKDYLFPSHINEIIIDSNSGYIPFLDNSFLKQLETLCCNYMQFRFFKPIDIIEIQTVLSIINPTQIKAIEFMLPWNRSFEETKAIEFIQKNRKVRNLTFSNSPYSKVLKKEDYLYGAVVFTKEKIKNCLNCGIVQMEQFALNLPHYTESLHHNTCLNRKIAIDAEGNIKNCPSMKESFGNIKDTTLEEAINKPGFKKYWNITKDQRPNHQMQRL